MRGSDLDPETILAQLCSPVIPDLKGVARRWASSGAMALTGSEHNSARQVHASLTERLDQAAELLTVLGGPSVDGPALLGERAAIAGFGRRGEVSVGGEARFLEASDGPICVNLPRPEDLALLPAWLEVDFDPTDWSSITAEVRQRLGAELASRADLLGLPVGVPDAAGELELAVLSTGGITDRREEAPLVADFGSLWAGPLCTGLLRQAGCRVIKVESPRRLDGARQGPRPFFDLLNGGKESVVVDPSTLEGRRFIHRLVDRADVVVETSRPRALQEWGLDAVAEAAAGTVWVSITGYGRFGERSGGVALGDDAAVSGGLFLRGPTNFVADAPADPATGLLAATLALAGLQSRCGWLIDISLAGVARWLAEDQRVPESSTNVQVALPRARATALAAADPGTDTYQVGAFLGV